MGKISGSYLVLYCTGIDFPKKLWIPHPWKVQGPDGWESEKPGLVEDVNKKLRQGKKTTPNLAYLTEERILRI